MLSNSRLQTIICTTDIQRAERFYSGILGLAFSGRSQGALVYSVGGADLRISPVLELSRSIHTVAGFAVPDLDATVKWLGEKGIALEKFPEFPHDERGILSIPGGDKVAWFRDPDGNLLSAVEFSKSVGEIPI